MNFMNKVYVSDLISYLPIYLTASSGIIFFGVSSNRHHLQISVEPLGVTSTAQ